jgi:hypothetical protein
MRLSFRVPLAAALLAALTFARIGLSSPPARAAAGLEGIPHFSHIVVLTEENENESSTFGPSSPATFLNSQLANGVFLPNYFGTGHVSLDNYLAMVSGQPGNALSNSDCLTVSLWTCVQSASAFNSGTHLGDQLDTAKLSWRSYMDGTPTPCFHAPYVAGDTTPDPYQGNSTQPPAYNYADRHNPFLYFSDFIGNQARCNAHQRPYSELSNALTGRENGKTLPAFSFITPDTCHDGHDSPCAGQTVGGLSAMDAWLQTNLPPLLHYLQTHNGLLIINFDESSPASPQPTICTTCASAGAGGQTGALLLGAGLARGTTITTGYDHYSLLRTIEDSLGITDHLGLASQSQAMTAAFAKP